MNPDEFEKYLADRYKGAIGWYDRKAIRNQRVYKAGQWILIILSAITPILIALEFGFSEQAWLKWIPLGSAAMVAIFTSALKSFKYEENWTSYRTTCETLKKEVHLYHAGIDDYAEADDKESMFVAYIKVRTVTPWKTS